MQKYIAISLVLSMLLCNVNLKATKNLYIEMVLVIDNGIYRSMDGNLSEIHEFCRNVVFYIDQMFIPLNLTVALKDVVIWKVEDEINVYGSSNITLLNFLEYRYDVLLETHPNDYAHLLTSRDFDYGVVGRSYSNLICSSFYSGGISTILNGTLPYIASVIAHEIGHNLGLTHDSKNCSCGPKLCLMSNSMGENEIDYLWSNCSIEQFRKLEIPNCLRNFPMKRFQESVCGNHIREAGEDCDCGLPGVCKAPCCNPKTCKFHRKGVVCRLPNGGCDVAEYCTGNSLSCPPDRRVNESEVCGLSEAICHKNSCKTRDDQCKSLWGRMAKEAKSCYKRNVAGTRQGNCGYDKKRNSFIPCDFENAKCGTLHCHKTFAINFKEKEVNDIVFYNFRNSTCTSVVFKADGDRGYAGDGTLCGANKMCLNRKCVPIWSVYSKKEKRDFERN